MAMMGQGLMLMIAGMGIVYAFLYVLILVSEWSSKFVSRFESSLPDDKPKKKVRAAMPETPKAGTIQPTVAASGEAVAAPVPGTVSLKVAVMDKVATGDTVALIS